jgi:hypothetical protein
MMAIECQAHSGQPKDGIFEVPNCGAVPFLWSDLLSWGIWVMLQLSFGAAGLLARAASLFK